eukprot:g59502.t1
MILIQGRRNKLNAKANRNVHSRSPLLSNRAEQTSKPATATIRASDQSLHPRAQPPGFVPVISISLLTPTTTKIT